MRGPTVPSTRAIIAGGTGGNMTIGKRGCIALLAALLVVPALAQEVVTNPEELGFAGDRLDRITRAFQGYVDGGQLPGAVVLIARNDKVAYFRAFGYRDREKKVAMTTDTIFRLASMTKPIVSTAAMILVEEGKLDLAAPVSQYLPEFKDLQVQAEHRDPATGKTDLVLEPQVRPMIVQDLLRHTAGLVYGPPIGTGPVPDLYKANNVQDRSTTLAEMVTKLSKLPLAHQPGEVWEYSVAVDVLGRVIEVASGMELDRFVEERITKPLSMTSTGFYVAPSEGPRIAQPQADAAGQKPTLFDPTVKPKLFSGGGGAVSTAGDYLRLCEMFLNDGRLGDTRLLAPSTVALMTSNALKPGIGYAAAALTRFGDIGPTPAMGQGFGLGFAVRTEAGENPLPGSVGSFYWTGAYGTTFYVDPEQKLIVIMMIQIPLGPAGGTYRHLVRALAYQALTAPN
jgi:CubicO group peptidase (beta-lactamase class C family)